MVCRSFRKKRLKQLRAINVHADNVGLVMLRSQTENRPIREQIEAALHYGTHGWAHGHYGIGLIWFV